MKHHRLLKLPLVGLCSLALLLGACGSEDPAETEDSLECGPGTVLSNGKCVVADFNCPAGEVPFPAGGCGDPAIFCHSSTTYDVELESCVGPETIACGEGTVAVDNTCLVEGAMICGEDTVLANGECVLSDSLCGNGTTLDGLQCTPADGACGPMTTFDVLLQRCVDLGTVTCGEDTIELTNRCIPMHTFLDELALTADLDYSDGPTEREINPGSEVGNTVVFTGTMTSTSLFHVYPFAVEPHQWLEITLYPRGIPSVGFRARSLMGGNWARRVLPGHSAIASRVVTPVSTNPHDLIVETSLSNFPSGPGVANEAWTYVGVVEVIEAPEALLWDDFDTPAGGDMRLISDTFIEVALEEDDELKLTLQSLGADVVDPLVEIWRDPTNLEETLELESGSTFTLNGVAGLSSVFLRLDAEYFEGPLTNFSLSAQETFTLQSGATVALQIDAQAGQILSFAHENLNGSPVAAQVSLDGSTHFSQESVLARNKSGGFTSAQSNRGFYLVPEDGTYTVNFDNTSSNDIPEFFPIISVEDIPYFQPPLGEASSFQANIGGDRLTRGNWRFALLETSEKIFLSGSVATSSGTTGISVLNLQQEEVASDSTAASFGFDLDTPDLYLLAIRPSSVSSSVSDIVLNLETSLTEYFLPGQSHVETFDAQLFDILTGTIDYRAGSAPDVRITNPDGLPILEESAVSGPLEFFELLPGSGTFTLEVTNNDDEPTVDLIVDATHHTPIAQYLIDEPSVESVVQTGLYEVGDRDFIIMNVLEELEHIITANVFPGVEPDEEDEEDEGVPGEEISLTLMNVQGLTEVDSTSDTGQARLEITNLAPGPYLLEITADTELADGYDLQWSVGLPALRSETGDPIEIPAEPGASSPRDETFFTSGTVEFTDDCPNVDAISVEVTKQNPLIHTEMQLTLTSPNDVEVLLFDFGDLPPGGASNTRTFDFPDNDTPSGDLDDFLGQSGDGVWSLDVGYNWGNGGQISEWTLTIECR